jgi:hypothetical protein
MHHWVTGFGIRDVAGLPKGAVLDMRLMGNERILIGRVESIECEGLEGTDRFARANPPAPGSRTALSFS